MLSQGNSTSAPGWVRKLSINDACPIHLAIALSFATLLCMEKEINHYTQRFPGKKNVVANALSRDFGLLDDNFTRLLQLANPPLACRRTSGSFSGAKPSSRTLESYCGSVDCDIITGTGLVLFSSAPLNNSSSSLRGDDTDAGDGIASTPIPSSDIPVGSMLISFESKESLCCTANASLGTSVGTMNSE